MVSGNLGTPFLLSPFPLFALRNEKAGGNFAFDDPGSMHSEHTCW